MKNYTFLLFPDNTTTDAIIELREKLVGAKYIDGLLPHLTFKKRFELLNGDEKYLKDFLENFNIGKIQASVKELYHWTEVYALGLESIDLINYHNRIVADLKENTMTVEPEHEGVSYKPHITLVRDIEHNINLKKQNINISDITFTKIGLYEIDSTPARAWSKEILSKDLY